MDGKKMMIMQNSIKTYEKLASDEQMFVLGFMQGVLKRNAENEKSVIMDKTSRVNINKTN